MISGKGILYTVLAASSAAVLLGTMLTGGKRREMFGKIGNTARNFFSTRNRKRLMPDQESKIRAEYDQAHGIGHS